MLQQWAHKTDFSCTFGVPQCNYLSISRYVLTIWFDQILNWPKYFFPQQHKLMGFSAQNRSGVHFCRRRVRFNEVPEKPSKVPEKVSKALVQSQVRFNRVPETVPEKVWRSGGRLWCRGRSSSTGFRRRFRRRLWCRGGQVQQRSWEGSGEGLGGFGAEPGQTQQGSEEGSGEGLGGFGAEPGHVQQGSGEGSRAGLGGFGADPAEVFPALGFAARFRKICKNRTLRLLGIPPKLTCLLFSLDVYIYIYIIYIDIYIRFSVCLSMSL